MPAGRGSDHGEGGRARFEAAETDIGPTRASRLKTPQTRTYLFLVLPTMNTQMNAQMNAQINMWSNIGLWKQSVRE